jgi:hypothetical protein
LPAKPLAVEIAFSGMDIARQALDFPAQSQVIYRVSTYLIWSDTEKIQGQFIILLEIKKFNFRKVELFGGVFWNFVIICHLTQPGLHISV